MLILFAILIVIDDDYGNVVNENRYVFISLSGL